MDIVRRPINHSDERGYIQDIFPSGAPDSVTLITSAPGAVRGNHVHAQSTQWIFVLRGIVHAYGRKPGGRVEFAELRTGDLLCHNPGEEHAYQTPNGAVFLAFAHGLRKGDDYEKDTQRVPSLIDAWLDQGDADYREGRDDAGKDIVG